MGARCLGCPAQNKKKPRYSIEPQDTSDFSPQKLSYKLRKLCFKGEVDNVEIINYPYDIIHINFIIFDTFQCSLPRQRKNNFEKLNQNCNDLGSHTRIKWKVYSSFEMRMDEYEIRKSFISISIFNQSPIPILQEKLNLYQVITGPYHHDIALNFENRLHSRLLFDLKISQKFQMMINPLEVSVLLNQQYPGEEFNYSFNAYSCGQKISYSDGSLPQKVNIFSEVNGSYRQLKPEDECQSPTKIRKGANMSKMIRNTMLSALRWIKPKQVVLKSTLKEDKGLFEQELVMPSFRFQLNSKDLNKSSLQFILWKVEYNKSLSSNQAILFADCYITFPRLFQTDYLSVEELQEDGNDQVQSLKKFVKKLQNRVCIIDQALIREGKSIGKITVKLNVINQIFFSQLALHARTQDGIVYMNSMFKNYIGRQIKILQSEYVVKIQSSFERIVNIFYNINHMKNQKKRNWVEFNLMEQKVLEELNILISLLNFSIEQSMVLARKHNLEEIMEKQNFFLGILERLYIFLEEENGIYVQQVWKVILLIMKRGQFYLQNIGFGHFDPTYSVNGNQDRSHDTSEPNTSVIYPKKVKTALRYQEMLYKILILALNYNYQSQRDTIMEAQAFKAYGYFRVPKFRQEVLKCIVKTEENIDYGQQAIQSLQQQVKLIKTASKNKEQSSSHLDWEKNFYFHLKNQKKYQQLNNQLVHNFTKNLWFQSLAQRRESFYIFIEYFSKKMADLGKRLKLLQYACCPGYNRLVKTFLFEMKKKPIIDYETCMIQTSTALLANHSLINIIIPIIVQKTNLYDSTSLNQFLNIFSNFLKFLTENGTKTIPQKFNHTYFFKIIKIILESDYSCAISKILVILHTYFECFNDEFKNILCLYLLSKAFFRLFFHWSFNIRIIFYHLFIIKIYWSKLNGVTQKYNHMDTYRNENTQIYARYKKLIKILNTAEKQKNIKKKNMKRAEKQEYYVKMRRKLSKKFKKHNPEVLAKEKQSESGVDSSSEHSVDKEKSLNLTRLQTLCELKDGYNRSETLCSTQIKEHLRKIQSQKQKTAHSYSQYESAEMNKSPDEENEEEVEKLGINLKIKNKKQKSRLSKENGSSINGQSEASAKEQIQKLNQQYIQKLSLVGHKTSSTEEKPLVYTFFGNDDYELEQISMNQENKILLGMEEFRERQQFVEKYILQKGVAPHVNLDPEIQLDSNEFKLIEISKL